MTAADLSWLHPSLRVGFVSDEGAPCAEMIDLLFVGDRRRAALALARLGYDAADDSNDNKVHGAMEKCTENAPV